MPQIIQLFYILCDEIKKYMSPTPTTSTRSPCENEVGL